LQQACTIHVSNSNILSLLLQAWEQEFAWTEAEKPVKMAAKALMVADSQNMSQQPIFCFETMMHMLYWSCLVYDYKRVMNAASLACCAAAVMTCQIFGVTC